MPNWAYTDYRITGDKKQVKRLYDMMKSLEDGQDSLVENGFGKTWLGNLISALGGDWQQIYCRGYWDNLSLSDGILSFSTESAWDRCEAVDDFLRSKFDGIQIFYIVEECGMGVYYTNDVERKYFTNLHVVEGETFETLEFETAEEAKEYIEEIIGRKLNEGEDLCEAISDWADEKDSYANYYEFVISE